MTDEGISMEHWWHYTNL